MEQLTPLSDAASPSRGTRLRYPEHTASLTTVSNRPGQYGLTDFISHYMVYFDRDRSSSDSSVNSQQRCIAAKTSLLGKLGNSIERVGRQPFGDCVPVHVTDFLRVLSFEVAHDVLHIAG